MKFVKLSLEEGTYPLADGSFLTTSGNGVLVSEDLVDSLLAAGAELVEEIEVEDTLSYPTGPTAGPLAKKAKEPKKSHKEDKEPPTLTSDMFIDGAPPA